MGTCTVISHVYVTLLCTQCFYTSWYTHVPVAGSIHLLLISTVTVLAHVCNGELSEYLKELSIASQYSLSHVLLQTTSTISPDSD